MKDKKTVLYCTHLRPSGFNALLHNSPLLSRFRQLQGLGLDLIVLGYSTTGRGEKRVSGDMEVCYINHRWSASRIMDEVSKAFPQYGSVPLVISRELPTTRYALRLADMLKCSAYYESLETWTGYHVINGRKLFPSYYGAFLRERLRIGRFRRVIVHSYPGKDYLVQLHRLDPERTGVLYSALPIPKDDSDNSVSRAVLSSDRLFLCSGGFAPDRGLRGLIDCFAYTPDHYKLLLAGDGPLKDELKRLVAERGLADKILFEGVLPSDQHYHRIRRADIGIDFRTSRTLNYDLAISCRVIDYINCGLPVITSSTLGFRDVEERLDVLRCMSSDLDPRQKAKQFVAYAEAFFNDSEPISRRLKHASETEFSYAANEKKFASWLSADGIVPAYVSQESAVSGKSGAHALSSE